MYKRNRSYIWCNQSEKSYWSQTILKEILKQIMNDWLEEMKINLLRNTADFSNQEKENIHFEYLKNLLDKIESKNITIDTDLQSNIEYVINEMPTKTNGNKIDYKSKHINEISNLQTHIAEKFSFVKKGNFRKRYMGMGVSLGMPFGLPFGAALGKIGFSLIFGMILGIIIGALVGNHFDKKAKAENRVL